jgi:CHAT domain-containing protein
VRPAFKGRPAIVHLATHGTFDNEVPLESRIALAFGEALTIADLAATRLDGCLIVMSACSTGAGRIQGGEVVGLARAVLAAGASAVIATLWPVPDVAAPFLMDFFYRFLGHFPLAEALARAQEQLRTMSAREALGFLEEIETTLNCKGETRASLESCRGDVLMLAGRPDEARGAYRLAEKLFDEAGCAADAQHLRGIRCAAGSDLPARDDDRRVFASPRFWAPFVILGDWRWAMRPQAVHT